MEINKIEFSKLDSSEINSTFEDLDVNSDGVINNKDKQATSDVSLQKEIDMVLNDIDEECPSIEDEDISLEDLNNTINNGSTVKKTASNNNKDKYGFDTTNVYDFENDVYNSKGTVYVVMGQTSGCSCCKRLAEAMANRQDELEGVAKIYDMNWSGPNKDLCREIYKQGIGSNTYLGASFPQIAKFVDGKFVELISNPRKYELAVEKMIRGAEAAPYKQDLNEDNNKIEQNAQNVNNGENKQNNSLDPVKAAQIKKYTRLNDALELQLKHDEDNLKKYEKEIEEKEIEYKRKENELKNQQEEYEKLAEKLQNATSEEEKMLLQDDISDITNSISSLTSELESLQSDISNLNRNYNIQKSIYNAQSKSVTKNQEKLKVLSENLTLTTKEDTIKADEIDWTALTVEGKGVNINNLVNILDIATGESKNDNDGNVVYSEIEAIHNNGTDEEKAIIDKLFTFKDNGKLTSDSRDAAKVIFTTMGKRGASALASLAYYDSDGDGFLSDDELKNMRYLALTEVDRISRKQSINPGKGIEMNGENITKQDMVKCSSFGDFTVTQSTINGKTVYFANNFRRSQQLIVTADEMAILDNFLNEENRAKYQRYGEVDLSEIWNALGATLVNRNQINEFSGQKYTLHGNFGYTANTSEVFVNSAGVICSYVQNERCSQCDESFYNLYAGIKAMMNNEEVHYYNAGHMKELATSDVYVKK